MGGIVLKAPEQGEGKREISVGGGGDSSAKKRWRSWKEGEVVARGIIEGSGEAFERRNGAGKPEFRRGGVPPETRVVWAKRQKGARSLSISEGGLYALRDLKIKFGNKPNGLKGAE